MNGSPLNIHSGRPDGDKRIDITPETHASVADAVWCRGCIRWACGMDVADPARKGETA